MRIQIRRTANSFRAITGKPVRCRPPKYRPYGRSGHRPGVTLAYRDRSVLANSDVPARFIPYEARGDSPLTTREPQGCIVCSAQRAIMVIGPAGPGPLPGHISPGPPECLTRFSPPFSEFRPPGSSRRRRASRAAEPAGGETGRHRVQCAKPGPRRDVIATARVRGRPPRQIHLPAGLTR
jgi:hypothetical protein